MEYSPAYILLAQLCILFCGFFTTGMIIYLVNKLNKSVVSVFSRSVVVVIFIDTLVLALFAVGQFMLMAWLTSLFPKGFGFAMGLAAIMCVIAAISSLFINVYLHFRRYRHARDQGYRV